MIDVMRGLCRDAYNSKTTGIADSACELSVSDPLHATLNHRYCMVSVKPWSKTKDDVTFYAQRPGQSGIERHLVPGTEDRES